MSTKDTLIEATAALLWERGYAATSPASIQKRSKAGQGSMYHHFSGKADLAVAAMRHSAAQLRAVADAALATGDSAVERVRAYLNLERDPLAGCRVGRLVQDHDVVSDDTLRAPATEFFTWLEGRIAEVLSDGVRSGELRPDADVDATAALIAAVVQGGYVLARAQGDPESFRRAARGAEQAVRGLLARPDVQTAASTDA